MCVRDMKSGSQRPVTDVKISIKEKSQIVITRFRRPSPKKRTVQSVHTVHPALLTVILSVGV